MLKSVFRRSYVSLDEVMNNLSDIPSESRDVLEAVLALPKKYRDVVYLHYYEGYTASEIGKIIKKNTNTVYTLLNRSKKLLYESLGGDVDG